MPSVPPPPEFRLTGLTCPKREVKNALSPFQNNTLFIMHIVECTGLDASRCVVDVLAKIGGGGSVTLKGEGKYVSTVSLAVALLCCDHSQTAKVGTWTAVPNDQTALHSGEPPSLSVSFHPNVAAHASLPAPSHLPLPVRHSLGRSPITPYTKALPSPMNTTGMLRGGETDSPVFSSGM